MPESPPPKMSERQKRVSDSLLRVPGILAVRVWEVGASRIEVGVRVAPGGSVHEALRRAREVTGSLVRAGESWHFGLLSEP